MSASEPTRHPSPPTDGDAQQSWELAGGQTEPEPLRGGLRDISRHLAVLTTAIALVAIVVAIAVLLLPT